MAGKVSKTNVAARREQRDAAKKTCVHCGGELEVVLMVSGRGKTKMVRLCCEKAGVASDEAATS